VRRVVRVSRGRSDLATGGDLAVVHVRAVAGLGESLGVSAPAGAAGSGAAGAGAGFPGSDGVVGECFAECVRVVVRAVGSVVDALTPKVRVRPALSSIVSPEQCAVEITAVARGDTSLMRQTVCVECEETL